MSWQSFFFANSHPNLLQSNRYKYQYLFDGHLRRQHEHCFQSFVYIHANQELKLIESNQPFAKLILQTYKNQFDNLFIINSKIFQLLIRIYISYGNAAYYWSGVSSTLKDPNGNTLAFGQTSGQTTSSTIDLQATGTGCGEYSVESSHRALETYYVTSAK